MHWKIDVNVFKSHVVYLENFEHCKLFKLLTIIVGSNFLQKIKNHLESEIESDDELKKPSVPTW